MLVIGDVFIVELSVSFADWLGVCSADDRPAFTSEIAGFKIENERLCIGSESHDKAQEGDEQDVAHDVGIRS